MVTSAIEQWTCNLSKKSNHVYRIIGSTKVVHLHAEVAWLHRKEKGVWYSYSLKETSLQGKEIGN